MPPAALWVPPPSATEAPASGHPAVLWGRRTASSQSISHSIVSRFPPHVGTPPLLPSTAVLPLSHIYIYVRDPSRSPTYHASLKLSGSFNAHSRAPRGSLRSSWGRRCWGMMVGFWRGHDIDSKMEASTCICRVGISHAHFNEAQGSTPASRVGRPSSKVNSTALRPSFYISSFLISSLLAGIPPDNHQSPS